MLDAWIDLLLLWRPADVWVAARHPYIGVGYPERSPCCSLSQDYVPEPSSVVHVRYLRDRRALDRPRTDKTTSVGSCLACPVGKGLVTPFRRGANIPSATRATV